MLILSTADFDSADVVPRLRSEARRDATFEEIEGSFVEGGLANNASRGDKFMAGDEEEAKDREAAERAASALSKS